MHWPMNWLVVGQSRLTLSVICSPWWWESNSGGILEFGWEFMKLWVSRRFHAKFGRPSVHQVHQPMNRPVVGRSKVCFVSLDDGFGWGNFTEAFQPRQQYQDISTEAILPGPSRLHFTPSLGPAISALHSPWAKPSTLYKIPQPSHLHFTQSLGWAISSWHNPSAQPSPLYTESLGRAISTLHHPSAQPSPLYTIPRPSHLHFTHSMGRAVSSLHNPLAQPSSLYTIPGRSRCGESPMALQVFPLFMDFYLQSLLYLIFACTCLDNQVSFSSVTAIRTWV